MDGAQLILLSDPALRFTAQDIFLGIVGAFLFIGLLIGLIRLANGISWVLKSHPIMKPIQHADDRADPAPRDPE